MIKRKKAFGPISFIPPARGGGRKGKRKGVIPPAWEGGKRRLPLGGKKVSIELGSKVDLVERGRKVKPLLSI